MGKEIQYIWQHSNWPRFEYDLLEIQDLLYEYARESSALQGGFAQIPKNIQTDTIIDLMVSEALNTSEIEGEKFNPEEIRSSIKKELGLATTKLPKDLKTIGISKLMILVRKTFNKPLNKNMLFKWHEMIMSGTTPYFIGEIGEWRDSLEPMQIISGPIGREKVHFEAPPSDKLEKEMKQFIRWFNKTDPKKSQEKMPGPVRAAITHLYFESIHPFSDGNGRIGRALSEKALSQELNKPVLLSLSATIQHNKKQYYQALSQASRSNSFSSLDITEWINFFVKTVYEAQLNAKEQINFVFQKTKFWSKYQSLLNDRQQEILERMLQAGPSKFEGGMQTKKYMKLTECSKATATRDLLELLKLGCLKKLPGSGRNTRYEIDFPSHEDYLK